MIRIEYVDIYGWKAAIRGMRNPKNSWDKSDTAFYPDREAWAAPDIGPNDMKLMTTLGDAGPVHGKYLRMITVTMDITAPLYWWKEFDTYKVGTVANSCSTMHKIHAKRFTIDDFSHEHLMFPSTEDDAWQLTYPGESLHNTIDLLNHARDLFIATKDKRYWWQMIQLLPSSYNQRRTVQLNYSVLKEMYEYRHEHKLDEWRIFCEHIKSLPYAHELIIGDTETDDD